MTMANLEKRLPSPDHEMSTRNTSLSSPLADSDGARDPEKQNDLLRPVASTAGSQLTPSVSRKSRAASQLSRSRSYVDSHSGYFSYGKDDNEDTRASGDSSAEGREFEVKFDENDPMNPRNMSTARKWIVVFTLAFGSLCVTCVSSLYTTTYDQIDVEFHSSTLVSTLGLTLFVWGLGLSPMVLGPISEFYGRRPVYVGAYIFFTIWLIPCGKCILPSGQYA
jgi:hypothetical protein